MRVPARPTHEQGGLRAKQKMVVVSAIVLIGSMSVIAAGVLQHASARAA
jgi:hypothetical protein